MTSGDEAGAVVHGLPVRLGLRAPGSLREEAVRQLAQELDAVAAPLAVLLGADLCSLRARAAEVAPRLVEDLAEADPAKANDILDAVWPGQEPRLDWWRTPLGLVLAPAVAAGDDGEDGWSHAEAAEVLGVTRGTIAQLVSRHDIDRAADGSCSRASVLARLVRLAHERER